MLVDNVPLRSNIPTINSTLVAIKVHINVVDYVDSNCIWFYAKPQYANKYLSNDKYATDYGHGTDIDSVYYICIQM